MRTKLFLSFLAVILIALVSNLIFQRLIIRDFGEYVRGAKEDRVYWVLASIEGSYAGAGWDMASLSNSLHWAAMLGYDAEVRDSSGKVMAARDVVEMLSPAMKSRMEALVRLHEPEGEFEEYPLYVAGEEIGSLFIRPLGSEGLLREREWVFRKRGKDFLLISFLIAGGGAIFLSLIFSLFLTRPVRRLKQAAEAVSEGDLSVRVKSKGDDEIARLAGSFNRMVETLQREEALRRHLTSNIAHELRTPLAVIEANIEAVIDGVIGSKEEGLENIRLEVQRLISLVEGIEDVTKAEAGFFKKAEYEKAGLRGFLEGITQSMRPLFFSKGIGLDIIREEEVEIETDTSKLETVIRNILSNSLRHTQKGGVRVDYGTEGKGFFIEISDTGGGIPDEDLPKIFTRFYRGRGSEGIGLGLSIAKELVDVMGGRIEVKGRPGEGASFKVSLPLRK
ncbi:MAG: HAMP domain-containing sensor histidine kinase [Thermodesulfovibrionales bacterium]|nr:HAMP domain-containing sensor histidine kinase [Thermodesulfovibrionales bacterium]